MARSKIERFPAHFTAERERRLKIRRGRSLTLSRRHAIPKAQTLGYQSDGGIAPCIPLPDAKELLWLERPMEGMEGGGGAIHDARQKAHQKKFKPQPITQAEMRDCAMTLDLTNCTSSPLDRASQVWTVCVRSTNYKSFFITNDLQQTILAAVDYKHSGAAGPPHSAKSCPLAHCWF